MKQKSIIVLLALFLLPASLFAADIAQPGTPLRKLQRGFLNIALSPIEISTEMAKDKKVDSFLPSWATAAGRGSMFMVGRALAGVYDLVTAPIPLPARYESLVQPEFAWEHFVPEEAPKR